MAHFNDGTDTFTKVEFVKGKDFTDLNKFLDTAKEGMSRMTDTVVAKLAKEGRKGGSSIESKLFSFQQHRIFGDNGRITESYWDSTLGGYRTKRRSDKQGNGYRLSNFKYVEKADKSKDGKVSSAVILTSQVANLFENNAHWTNKSSPLFTFGKNNKMMFWDARNPRRNMRRGRHYFNEYVRSIFASESTAIKETVDDYERWMKRNSK